MYAAFVRLLNMSAAAGILIPAVIALRFLLRRTPKKYICILWALVALRLVCPISVSSAVSAYNYIGHGSGSSGQVEYIHYNGKSEKPEAELMIPVPVEAEAGKEQPQYRTKDVYIPTLFGFWAAGAAVMLLCAAVSYYRIRLQVRESIRLHGNVFLCDRIPSPFILGIIRPKIYLPSELDRQQQRSVIAHERAHIARLDHWWKPLGYGILCVHWFNPLVWLAYGLLCRDIEMACDERVIGNMTPERKQEYAALLLSCSLPKKLISACPLAFGEADVKERIRGILNYKKPSFWAVLLSVILCLALAVGFLSNPLRTEDYLLFKGASTKFDQPHTFDFQMQVGKTVKGPILFAELWQNGVLMKSEYVTVPDAVEELNLTMTNEKDGDSLSGCRVQITSEPEVCSLDLTIPLPEGAVWLKDYSWHGTKDISPKADQEILLAASLYECENDGFFLFSFDNENYGEDGGGLREQECVVLVYAVFPANQIFGEPESEHGTLSAAAETSVSDGGQDSNQHEGDNDFTDSLLQPQSVPEKLLPFLNPAQVEFRDNTLIDKVSAGKQVTLEELLTSDSWTEQPIPEGVTGPGSIRRGLILRLENGNFMVISYDTDALCIFNVNGDCLGRYTGSYTGEQMVDMLWHWMTERLHNGTAFYAGATLTQTAPNWMFSILLHPTTALNIDGMGAVTPENQSEWISAWQTVLSSAVGSAKNADAGTYYGIYLFYQDTYLEVHRDSTGFFLREMGSKDTYSAQASQPLIRLLEPVLQELDYSPVKPSELKGIQYANLVLDGMRYTIVQGSPKLSQLENILTSGTPIGYMPACWFTSLLTVTLENGQSYTVSVATDDCGVYLSDGVCYEFPGDNGPLYQLFGVNQRQ